MKKLKKYSLFITLLAFTLLSCSKKEQGDLLEIPIDINQVGMLNLSEITESITAIELELTDESILNPDHIGKVFLFKDEIFVGTAEKILVFNKTGKFLRSIGSKGHGPGEYARIHNFALDEKNKCLFITSSEAKILSYDLNGNFIKEVRWRGGLNNEMNYIDGKLLLLVEKFDDNTSGIINSQPTLFQLNKDMQVVDSCIIRNLHIESNISMVLNRNADFILKGTKSTYLYYGDFWVRMPLGEKMLCDTLYRLEDNQLIPELKLKFRNEVNSIFLSLYNIYRSSRYVFSTYTTREQRGNYYLFCYDTKTNKGYSQLNGLTDDIHRIENPKSIRPFSLDTEMFYYFHTHIKDDDRDEPNPTLYIGKLKK